ncbi:MAG: hypothetical protein K0Q99_1275 [Clostridia bacterium]|nr:hypothetical protein [Clostridia bacterium]
MNNSQIENDIRRYYECTELPNIDFKNNIMNQARNRKNHNRRWVAKTAIVFIAMLLTLSVTFAGTQLLRNIFAYKDNGGDMAWRYDLKTPADGVTEIESEYRDIGNYIRTLKLKPGMSVAVFKRSKVEPEGIISAYTAPVSTIYENKFKEMLKDRPDFLKICSSIPEGYQFLVGSIKYRPIYNKDNIRKEGLASDQDLYVKEIETVKTDIMTTELVIGPVDTDGKSHFGIELKIYEAKSYTPDKLFYGSVGSTNIITETVKLGSVEGSYMKYGNGKRHQILWFQKGEDSKFVLLEGRTDEITKENLIKMALDIEMKYQP